VLSLDDLRAANREVRPQERFGKTLVTHGYLEPRHLWDGIRDQLEEIVWSVMAYREGVLAFWDGEVAPDNLARIDFNTRELLERGVEWRNKLEEWIEDVRGDAVRISSIDSAGSRAGLDGLEAHITDALLGDARFEEVCRRSGFDLFTVARTLRLLEDAGWVEIRRIGDDPESTLREHNSTRARQTRRQLSAANHCIESMLQGLEPYDLDGLATRTRAAFEEVSARFPGALGELSLTHQLLLPVDALEKRLFDAPEELRQDALEAIGALLDYLEFEVVNHSEFENSSELLEALRPYREEATR
jgi:hypothetical protein